MTRYTLHVPEQYNDGTRVGAEVTILLEADIVHIAGGFTATTARGAWRGDDGRIYNEPMTVYLIDSDDPEVAGKLHRLAERIADALRQEAVYLTHQQIGTELVAPVVAAP